MQELANMEYIAFFSIQFLISVMMWLRISLNMSLSLLLNLRESFCIGT